MNHLVLYAHPNPASFCAAVRGRLVETLQELGHTVCVRDLYADGYQPILQASDFEHFFRGVLPDDIRAEQQRVAEADVLHLIYPLWWTGLPAMLKGYVERTMAPGFAYRRGADGTTITPLLVGKKAMLWTPHGNTQQEYAANGMYEAMRKTIQDGVLEYVGIEVLAHTYFPDIRATSLEQRAAWLNEVDATLRAHHGAVTP